jgi:hypothetical protein
MKRTQIQQRMLIRDYYYHLESLEDIKEIYRDCERRFKEEIMSVGSTKIKELLEPRPEKKADESVQEISEDIKKIYKKAVVKTHPDKVDGKEEIYHEIVKAAEEGDSLSLVLAASKAGLDVSKHIEEMNSEIVKKIKGIKKEIKGLETSIPWMWDKGGPDQKNMFVSKFIDRLSQKN